jgi:hypothetical protein
MLDLRVGPEKLPYFVEKREQLVHVIVRIGVAMRRRQKLRANLAYFNVVLHDYPT